MGCPPLVQAGVLHERIALRAYFQSHQARAAADEFDVQVIMQDEFEAQQELSVGMYPFLGTSRLRMTSAPLARDLLAC
jgi:hypothetical protein